MNVSASIWSMNNCSSSLVKNKDDRAITSTRSENDYYNKEDGWGRYYDKN